LKRSIIYIFYVMRVRRLIHNSSNFLDEPVTKNKMQVLSS
jgi:hypothetical protein